MKSVCVNAFSSNGNSTGFSFSLLFNIAITFAFHFIQTKSNTTAENSIERIVV